MATCARAPTCGVPTAFKTDFRFGIRRLAFSIEIWEFVSAAKHLDMGSLRAPDKGARGTVTCLETFRARAGPGQRSLKVGRLGSEGFWEGDYCGGGPGRPPFWRTLVDPVRGCTPVP
jgi:hypothetical protein